MNKLNELITVVNQKFDALENRMDRRFEALETRMDSVERKLETVEKRLDAVDLRLKTVEKRLDTVDLQVKQVSETSTRTAILVENQVLPNINLLFEGQTTIHCQLNTRLTETEGEALHGRLDVAEQSIRILTRDVDEL